MSEQDGIQPSIKQRRSRKTNTTNQKNGKQARSAQHPSNKDKEGWKAFWISKGQPWRTEPEIDVTRQKILTDCYNITPDIEQGIYPFEDVKLNRADIEWLLATHNQGQGMISEEMVIFGLARGLDLRGADLSFVDLNRLPLSQVRGGMRSYEWGNATKEQREAAAVHLEGADLNTADLRHTRLRFARLEGANLQFSRLEGANLRFTYFAGTASSRPADLRHTSFDQGTILKDVILSDNKYGTARLADVNWGNVNLAVVDWTQLNMLGDEQEARRKTTSQGEVKSQTLRLEEYQEAVRANRQLSITLQGQGLNEDAARFAYRAQLLQRKVFWYQRKFGQYLFSLFLNLLAGYGYRPGRSFIAYALVISIFATIYLLLGNHIAWNEAIVISMTAFHGRGFFPEQFKPGDPQALVAAIEAFVGLLIEVTFIATLTQRLFSK